MASGPEGRGDRAGPLSLKQERKKKKKNKKKKDYLNEDVNGFAAYLEQSCPGGAEVAGTDCLAFEKEVAVAMRKDKRREDRRLKRQERKKNAMVCFHCRESGHGVADCPAVLESQDMGTGICYRCGSTEHDISKCKAKIDPAAGAFPYAKCFICGEMGHLSRSCPDNPKGLYAEGYPMGMALTRIQLVSQKENFQQIRNTQFVITGFEVVAAGFVAQWSTSEKTVLKNRMQIRLQLGDGLLE